MKVFRKAVWALGLLSSGVIFGQSSDMRNIFKFRIHGGYALGKHLTANVAGDITYQHMIAPGFGIGLTTGYNHFFKEENKLNNFTTIKNNSVGIIPAALLLRFYPQQIGFYIGADTGYGFLMGKKQVAENYSVERPSGGFYIKPEIGWHNRNWNIFAHYTKVFTGDKGTLLTQKYDVSSVGIGVSYNLELGAW